MKEPMPRISDRALREVREALKAFRVAVEEAGYRPASAWTHTRHAEVFVRWLEYEWEPGAQLRRDC